MIHYLPTTTTHNAPVNKIKASTLQIVTCKNLIPNYNSNKERNTPRSLNLSNTFSRKDNGQGTSKLVVKRADIKISILLQPPFHTVSIFKLDPKVQRNSSITPISQSFGSQMKRTFQLLHSSIPTFQENVHRSLSISGNLIHNRKGHMEW